MAKTGFSGILEVDDTTGTITFHADPRYFAGRENAILTILGLADQDLDLRRKRLHLTVDGVTVAVTAPPPTPSPTKLVPLPTGTTLPIRTVATMGGVPVAPDVQLPAASSLPFSYANVLYPAAILQIMGQVLNSEWQGPDPEKCIDSLIAQWVEDGAVDPQRYARSLVEAVRARGCLDVVLARLNAEIVSPPDEGDTITICRNRRFRLPGENGGPGHYTNNLPVANFHDPEGDTPDYEAAFAFAFQQAEQFYADEKVYQLRPPRPNLAPEVKEAVRQRLLSLGYQLVPTVSGAMEVLEKMLRERDLEQLVLGRLLYLAIFQALHQVDGRAALGLLPPAPQLTSGIVVASP